MSEDDVVRPLPPRRPGPARRPGEGGIWRTLRTRAFWIIVPLLLVIGSVLRFYVDLLWFGELDQRDVLVTRLQWGLAMGVGFGLLTFVVLFVNFRVARRVAREDLYVPFLAHPMGSGDPEAPEQPIVPHFVLKPILLGVAAVAAVIAGLVMSSRWEVVLRFLGRTDFGVTDPHFGKDASFYVFTMPLLELVTRSLQVLLVITGIGVVLAYVATGVIRYTPIPRVARAAIVHLSWLVAAFLLVSAFQYRLSIWSMATSTRGYVAGAGWTDTHARIPGYWLMLVASVVLAVLVIVYARREKWRVVGGAVAGWFAASIVVTGLIPTLVQQVLVEPNQLERETKLIEGNIANTRAGFGLDAIETKSFVDMKTLTEAQLTRDNTGTTDNLRLWSPFVLNDVINQDQVIKRYYAFHDPDVDRYTVGGDYRQVMVAVRELDPGASAIAPGWTNERLAYTHGYGAIATLPNEVTREGKPEYLLRDLSLRTTQEAEAFELTRPEVYFGESGTGFVIVGTKQREVSGAAGDEGDEDAAPRTDRKYEGEGGIPVSNFMRRIAFASTFRDPRILFSGQFTEESRLLFRRQVTERVQELAPFLELDRDPYAVIDDGRIRWIVDAYTTSDRFPYSEAIPLGGEQGDAAQSRRSINYVRNSVKVVVDAYDGDVTFYVTDEDDPILQAWRDIFPDLFQPFAEMPEALRAHVRYPEDLFAMQTERWKRYHMADVNDFYAREDEWDVPTIDNQPMQAYYVLAKLPGEDAEELLLIRPMTPRDRKNMVSYMVARSDGEQYGQVQTLRLSTQEATQGPSQIQARIKQDSDVATQVREWTTGNNTVVFGDLLVLPVEQSLLYAQPVYLVNEEAKIPEFRRIVLALGQTIAWGDDFSEAAERLLAEQAADVAGEGEDSGDEAGDTDDGGSGDAGDEPAAGDAGDATDVPAPSPGDFAGLGQAELAQLVTQVSAAYDRAQACQRRGDTVCYAEELETVERLLADARRGADA